MTSIVADMEENFATGGRLGDSSSPSSSSCVGGCFKQEDEGAPGPSTAPHPRQQPPHPHCTGTQQGEPHNTGFCWWRVGVRIRKYVFISQLNLYLG